MNNIVDLLLPALISSVFGIISAFLTAYITIDLRLKKQLKVEKEKENERVRLKYLNPLLVAGMDLLERILDIKERRLQEETKNQMVSWFLEIKNNNRTNRESFEFWANDEGYFAMSTLYVTAVYFAYASKIRIELPFIELRPGDDKALLSHLSEVRTAIGGTYGIWETIQDSLGSYLINKEDNTIKNYREFCENIIDKSQYVWFNRLIDFYRDIDKKSEAHIARIESSLQMLVDFMNKNLQIKKINIKYD
jgi:hypothetical protein